mmetsp:Transcript_23/g.55  ORF Transcript_23/g.55 Transcript_23/m.55 type:complete len:234 (-) Transcript_23:86-787(-)
MKFRQDCNRNSSISSLPAGRAGSGVRTSHGVRALESWILADLLVVKVSHVRVAEVSIGKIRSLKLRPRQDSVGEDGALERRLPPGAAVHYGVGEIRAIKSCLVGKNLRHDGVLELDLREVSLLHQRPCKVESGRVLARHGALPKVIELVSRGVGLADGRGAEGATILVLPVNGRKVELQAGVRLNVERKHGTSKKNCSSNKTCHLLATDFDRRLHCHLRRNNILAPQRRDVKL